MFQLDEKPLDRVALRSDEDLVLTYGDLVKMVQEVHRLNPDNRLVFCMCENHPGAVAGYLAFLEDHMVPLLLSANIGAEQFAYYEDCYEPGYIWASKQWVQDHAAYMGEMILNRYGYCLIKTGHRSYKMHPDLALLLTTSGSTGNAKLVRLSRENIRSNAEAIISYLHIDEKERPITMLPMNYTYGLSIIHSHILAGACILMTKSGYVQQQFWEFLEKEQATSISGVPYTYEILKRMRLFRNSLPSIHTLTQAGGHLSEKLQAEVAEWAELLGASFYVMYGQTEATARMAYLPPEEVRNRIGSIGKAIPGGSLYLEDAQGSPITDPEQVGELIYNGPNVCLGYASGKADLLLGDENQGVLRTGDMAKRDADGFFYIVGRKKRFVKIFGTRVSLDACEELLRSHFSECEIACAGRDDALCIYTTADQTQADQMAELLSDTLRMHWKGFTAISVERIPKNETGKIQYQELNGDFAHGDS